MADSSPDALVRQFADLLSLAVHEFRTPSSVVGGYLRMLQRDTEAPLTDRQRKMIDESEKAFGRILTLVNELSEIGKLDDGRMKLQQAPLDLFALAGEVASRTDEAADRGVRLEVSGEANGGLVLGDAPRLQSALATLFKAVLREQPSGQVIVAERRLRQNPQPAALIAITEAADIERALATPPGPLDENRGGIGLGLPIARRVIERHGGRVWSASTEAGKPVARSGIILCLPIQPAVGPRVT